MVSETVKVLWNHSVGPEYFRIGLECHAEYARAEPGQFVMLRIPDRIFPLLRRPFSIHRLIESNQTVTGIEVLYKVVGKGTRALSTCRMGDRIDLLGPLGKGFVVSRHHEKIFMVAGGIGVAPMVFLASFIRKIGIDTSKCTAFLGGRSKDDLLCIDDFVDSGMDVRLTTDDGSAGDTCLVTLPLSTELDRKGADIIYACGPMAMIKCVAEAAEMHGVPCQVSVETVMACGMGTCLGCAMASENSNGKYLHACVDGPVFDIRNLTF